MKKLIFLFTIPAMLFTACGGETETENESSATAEQEKKKEKYYVEFGDRLETRDALPVGGMYTYNHQTKIMLEGAELIIMNMDEDFYNDPQSIVGNEYEATLTFEENDEGGAASHSGTAKITKLEVEDESDIGYDYNIVGEMITDGQTGEFNLSMKIWKKDLEGE